MNAQEITLKTLKRIDDRFEDIQNELLIELGDEANDIGDAGDALELIQNVVTEYHETYNYTDFIKVLVSLIGDEVEILKTYQYIQHCYLEGELTQLRQEYENI